MTTPPALLTIRRPDDWHLHLRDDEMMRAVLPYTSRVFGRAIVMPNLTPPITSIAQASAYRERILAALPEGHRFEPLMTCYLTDTLDKAQLVDGFAQGIFSAAKLYPANATTNSSHGVTNITGIYPLFAAMADIGMPLLVHGEVTTPEVDIFDREARFIEQVLEPLRRRFPTLKIVMEHITTREAAHYILAADDCMAATVTPQHLMFNRNHMLVGGVRPHLYCLPILKRNIHQDALRAAVAGGCPRLFLGTDSAPHGRRRKESDCGCAGVFNAPNALSAYATVFEQLGALAHFEAFCSLNGPRFYGLPVNEDRIVLRRQSHIQPESIAVADDVVVPFLAGQPLDWQVEEA